MKPTQGSRPNGIVLSPDENTLYVGDVGNKSITKYTLAADGTRHDRDRGRVRAPRCATPSTACASTARATSTPARRAASRSTRRPAAYIGMVPTGESSNCTFGGADRKTMYVTSRAQLKYVTLAVPGLPD